MIILSSLPRTTTRAQYRAIRRTLRRTARRNLPQTLLLACDLVLYGCCFSRMTAHGRLVRIAPRRVAYGPDGLPAVVSTGQAVNEGLPL